MKVLFAVSNENISDSIVKKYQKQYKEIISYKNVYYFNAIQKEIQKDKSYDRIVIGEDLEQFTNTSYEQVDKFIFERLDSISDEASNMQGDDIPIILICNERRAKSEPILVKLFGIGVYNAIIGNDRSIEEVCRLIHRPRSKKEAKVYYKIEAEDVNYQAENENDVSEVEIQNILMHYKRLGKNEEKYVDSFNNIAAQYNDTQLRIISKFLPLNVRAVLEENSSKYQQIMSFNNSVAKDLRYNSNKKTQESESVGPSGKLLKSNNPKTPLSKPIVIPSEMNTNKAKRLTTQSPIVPPDMSVTSTQTVDNIMEPTKVLEPIDLINSIEPVEATQPEELTQMTPIEDIFNQDIETQEQEVEQKRKRGRPRKNPEPVQEETTQKRKRGRPRKNPEPVQEFEDSILPGFDEENDEIASILPETNIDNEPVTELPTGSILPGFDNDDIEEPTLPGVESVSNPVEEMRRPEPITSVQPINNYNTPYNDYKSSSDTVYTAKEVTPITEPEQDIDISHLLTPSKKLAAFVGTSKNGTSFAVNNVAELLSSMGVNTAILDTTQNRNSYYIYTKNEEQLRNVAFSCIDKLKQGIAQGIEVNKNLSVYTALPDEEHDIKQAGKILETLVKNHTVVLIDCDFDTPKEYFAKVQEIYLVQTMDVLTIQPLTAFLRDLKSKNVLDEHKIRIVVNKYTKIRGITEKTIIGGMAFYNDPSMSFMTELFDRTLVKYTLLPFEEETYIKYLEGLINCNISLKGYSKGLLQALKSLGNMVYPVMTGAGKGKPGGYQPPAATNNGFSENMNNTLNQMKQNY